jgi:acetyltransferase
MIMQESSQLARAVADIPLLHRRPFFSTRGRLIVNRLVADGDVGAIAELLAGLSARSLYLRYGMPMPRMPLESAAREAARLGQLGSAHHLSAVAVVWSQGQEQVIAVAELAREPGSADAPEIALVVADAYQREGIGSALCAYLVAAARREGLTALRVMALAENTAVRRMVARSGASYRAETRQGMTTIQIDLRGASSADGLAAA